jgi:hypothetical protein
MIGALVKRYWLHAVVANRRAGVLRNHYRDNAITYKDQRDKATVRADTSEAITRNVITTMNSSVTSHRLPRMQRTNWSNARRALSTSGRRLKAIRALTSLFFCRRLTACGNTQTSYCSVPVVPISADLTADTPIPE